MAVVVDSAASLPSDLADPPVVVPMTVVMDGQSHLDGVDLTPSALYRRLAQGSLSGTPTTSAPPPERFFNAFTKIAAHTSAALCITVSRRFSAAADSARLAVERAATDMPELEVALLDSGSAAGGEGLVVLRALEVAATCAALSDVESEARAAAASVRLVAYVDTLYYLWKGGRVPGIARAGASLLGIKPVFEMSGGRVARKMPSRTSRRAAQRLVSMVAGDAGSAPVRACVMHAAAPEEAVELGAALGAAVECKSLYVAEFSPVIGAHIGPGSLGIAYLPV